MRGFQYWGVLVGAGLGIGAIGATGVMHVAGLDVAQKTSGPRPVTLAVAADIGAGASTLASTTRDAETSSKPAVSIKVAQVEPSPSPTPAPPPPKSLFDTSQIVSYYGRPGASIWVWGEGTDAQAIARLKKQAAAYQAVNSEKTVVPALHLVYEVAQQFTADDGLYLVRTDEAEMQRLIQLTADQGMLLFLDLQIGRSSLEAEVQNVLPYLKYPNVHLAIDPEFVTPPGQRPGLDIGTLDCLAINAQLDIIEQVTEQAQIPNKIVIVHQFQDDMLTHKDQLRFDEPRVDTVLLMDGFGAQSGKLSKYDSLIKQAGVKYAGIKLFYKYDTNLFTEQQVEDLDPRPDIIMYQ